MRMLLCVVLVAACGGTQTPATGAGSGSGSGSGSGEPTQPIAQTLLGFSSSGFDPASVHPLNKLFLDVTNHNGATQSYPVGEVAAPCLPGAGNGRDIVATLRCDVRGTGAELRAVYRGVDVIILRRNYTPDDDPADAELAFQEVTRVSVPPGSKVGPAL